MPRFLWSVVGRLVACIGVTYLAWRLIGAVGLAACAPLFGVAFARPILDFFEGSGRLAKQFALRNVEGRHYEHKGNSIDIVEDADHYRWLRTADVRKVIKSFPNDEVLQRLYPADVRHAPPQAAPRIRAEALARYLTKSTDANSLSFKLWLERVVTLPADRRREHR